jgi:hypothetical protein
MNFKPIKLKNGTVYMCPYKVDTASEEIASKDIIIAELADRYEKQSVLMDEMAEAMREICDKLRVYNMEKYLNILTRYEAQK